MKIKNLKLYLSNLPKLAYQHFLLENKDILAMQHLAPIFNDYLPWNSYAIRPSGLVKIINEIILNNRTKILECGGGISTLYIAKILQERGGHLYTIEHDADWVIFLQKLLAQHGLTQYVSLVTAPLEDCPFNFYEVNPSSTPNGRRIRQEHSNLWYSLDIIKDSLCDVEIDLLIVDGPPAYTKNTMYARYPAVPFLKQYFASDYAVILDDISRFGEKKIVNQWQKELGINFKRSPILGGIAIAYSQAKFIKT
jgi:hypothetical protein